MYVKEICAFVLDYLLNCSYDKNVKIDFDPGKSQRNIKLRSLSFEKAGDFDWGTAIYYEDNRMDCPETRIIALGFLEARLYVICFTQIDGAAKIKCYPMVWTLPSFSGSA